MGWYNANGFGIILVGIRIMGIIEKPQGKIRGDRPHYIMDKIFEEIQDTVELFERLQFRNQSRERLPGTMNQRALSHIKSKIKKYKL